MARKNKDDPLDWVFRIVAFCAKAMAIFVLLTTLFEVGKTLTSDNPDTDQVLAMLYSGSIESLL